ncbi:MAG: ErfK/YbiS/YcfS/YnhG family protein [Deltaproteobacteria bacterium]|jgi:L,D-transpeptidase ErfK/SrfK|nr:ErfK/YbiS/YcfS/YnhG family protein [Deltaproteobacteria bacterium]
MFLASAAVLISCSILTFSLAAELRREGTVIGRLRVYPIKPNESLPEIARRYDIGIEAISAANPGVDLFIPDPGSWILLPTEWILPDTPIRTGIVVNIAEMRLFVFSHDRPQTVTTFPIGIGDEGKETPVGTFTVIEKIRDPAWYVPESIRKERPDLPAVVPPGPDNPMGSHALRLSKRTVLIHGTNRPWGIGARVSHGCIRLYQEDIALLFGMIRRGTRVSIVDHPVKAAAMGDRVYLQVHNYEEGRDLYSEALKVLEAKNLSNRVDLEKTRKACRERTGLLVDISR